MHTPGPWYYSRWDEHGTSRFYIAQAEGAQYTPNFSDVATLVAETVSIERVTVQEANARLIAGAPELLAMLEAVYDWQHGHGSGIGCTEADMRDLIAKAKGGAA